MAVESYDPKEFESSTEQIMEDKFLDELIRQIEEENYLVRLRQIREMLEEGLITVEEYETKKKEILDRF